MKIKHVLKILLIASYCLAFWLMEDVEWYKSIPIVAFISLVGYADGYWAGLNSQTK